MSISSTNNCQRLVSTGTEAIPVWGYRGQSLWKEVPREQHTFVGSGRSAFSRCNARWSTSANSSQTTLMGWASLIFYDFALYECRVYFLVLSTSTYRTTWDYYRLFGVGGHDSGHWIRRIGKYRSLLYELLYRLLEKLSVNCWSVSYQGCSIDSILSVLWF